MWLLPAFLLTCVLYYFFIYTPSTGSLPYLSDRPNGLLHWTKRPEKYPIDKYLTLPKTPAAEIPRIQYDFNLRPETVVQRKTREERQAAVKEAFVHSWEGYKKHAWLKDEVAPVSGMWRSSFGGWGATLVDTMDTLWIMGLQKDFELCVEAIQSIDFTTNTEKTLNVFETTIRYLGGFLAAYDLSNQKYPILLQKAQQLGEILYTAFDTPNRMPQCRWEWRKSALGGTLTASESTLVAELGSLTLEFTRLSQLTGDDKYYDAVARIMQEFYKSQNSTLIPGLWPTIVNAKELQFSANHFTFGGMADSTYEYLPKQHMMLGGQDPSFKEMYETAIETAKKVLFFKPMLPKDEDVLYSGNTGIVQENGIPGLDAQGQHLTCFVGGMVGIGAKIFNRPDDLSIAKRLVQGCIWAYNAVPSGLMPETFHLVPCHTGVDEPEPGRCEWDDEKWYQAIAAKHDINSEDAKMSMTERGKYWAKLKTIFPGFTDIGDARYILRPEAIESVFILYRITGDPIYQDTAWRMFQSIDKATRTSVAHAAINDVRKQPPEQSDRMESFWLAETLKYFYLIFSEPTLVNLDDYVLNTEAHPLRRP